MLDMILAGPAAWFGVPALVGSVLFLIRIVLMLAGGHHGGDFHHDVPDSGTHDGDSKQDTTGAFKLLSVQAITAFAMGFGWAGLAALNGFHKSMFLCTVAATAGGVVMVWFLALMLKAMFDLQASGNISLDSTIGREGDVYATVPPKGQGLGQVRVVVSDRMRIFNAISDGAAVPTASKIRVVGINEDNSLTVTPT